MEITLSPTFGVAENCTGSYTVEVYTQSGDERSFVGVQFGVCGDTLWIHDLKTGRRICFPLVNVECYEWLEEKPEDR